MIHADVEYCESQDRDMIEEYARENSEAETEAEAMTRDKDEGIERAKDKAKAKARAEDDMRKQVWRDKYLGIWNYKTR